MDGKAEAAVARKVILPVGRGDCGYRLNGTDWILGYRSFWEKRNFPCCGCCCGSNESFRNAEGIDSIALP